MSIDADGLRGLAIPNLRIITRNDAVIGVRGESLSGRNRKYLWAVKKCGIHTIIDLRTADHTNKFKPACEEAGFNYFNFPVDQSYTSDEEMLRNLPQLINAIEQGGFYLACALGLHRTDIALALCWLFVPQTQEPPIMFGHHRDGTFKCEDVFRRANSLYRTLTQEDKECLGWDGAFDKGFEQRKKLLTKIQSDYIGNQKEDESS